MPSGSQNGIPGASGRRVNRPSCGPEAAMVARARLLEELEVLLELLLGEERGPVDAGEHLAPLVAAPVGPRDRAQLEGLDPAGRGPVRAAAQVHEGAVPVQRHGFDPFVALSGPRSARPCRAAARRGSARSPPSAEISTALEGLVRLDVGGHPLLDPLQVRLGGPEPVWELEVVVEAVARSGDRSTPSCRATGRGPLWRARGRQSWRRTSSASGWPGRHDLDPLAVGERRREVADLAVHLDGERILRQPGPDRRRGVGAGRALRRARAPSRRAASRSASPSAAMLLMTQ